MIHSLLAASGQGVGQAPGCFLHHQQGGVCADLQGPGLLLRRCQAHEAVPGGGASASTFSDPPFLARFPTLGRRLASTTILRVSLGEAATVNTASTSPFPSGRAFSCRSWHSQGPSGDTSAPFPTDSTSPVCLIKDSARRLSQILAGFPSFEFQAC